MKSHVVSHERPRALTGRSRQALALLSASIGLGVVTACGAAASSGTTSSTSAASTARAGSARIGVIEIAPVPIFDVMMKGFKQGFAAAAGLPQSAVHLDIKNAEGQTSLVQLLARELPRGNYDQFAVIGTPAVIALAQHEKSKPIIAIAMTDPVGAGVAKSLARPGGNVTGTSDQVEPKYVAAYLAALRPRPKQIGTIVALSNEVSSSFVKAMKPLLKARGMTLTVESISSSADVSTAARALVGRVDVIALPPDALSTGIGLPAISAVAVANRLPIVAAAGIPVSTAGVLATLSPSNAALGALAGKEAGQIFAGKAKAATTGFVRPTPKVAIDHATAKRLGITAPTSLPGG